MWEKFAHLFRIPELRKRILFTLGAIVVFRFGTHIAVPGVDAEALKNFFATQGGGIFDFLNMFTGGALQRFSLFALGVTPYINASIIFSLLTAVIPKLKELQQQGREGRRKITTYTRWATLGLAVIQGATMSMLIVNWQLATGGIWFFVTSILSLTTGTNPVGPWKPWRGVWKGKRAGQRRIRKKTLGASGFRLKVCGKIHTTWSPY